MTAPADAGNPRDDSPGTGADPAAVDDGFTTDEDTPFTTGDVRGSDAEGQPLTVTAVDRTGTKGQVTDNGDGTFDYDPNGQFEELAAGETATDSFAYTVDDGQGGTSTATVTITITGVTDNSDPGGTDDPGTGGNDDPGTGGNGSPDAVDDEATTDEQAATTIDVRANDSDPDQADVLTVTVIDDTGTRGRVTIDGKGKVDYDPHGTFDALKEGESATDTFAYTVDDGHGGTDTATVQVTIEGVDDAPDEGDDETRDDPEDGAPKPPQDGADGADAAKWVALGDGFESGDLSQWTESDGLQVQAGAAAAGRYGARAKSTGDAAYATKTLSSEESDLYARVKFQLLDQGKNPVTLLALRTAAGDALVSVYIGSDGRLNLGNAVTGATATGPTTVTKGVWHEVEVHAQTGTSGQIEVWYDGQRIDKLSGNPQLGTKAIGRVVLGESSRGRSYDVAFDDVAVDTSFVRPEIVADDAERGTSPRRSAMADEPVDPGDSTLTLAALEDDTTPPETTIDTAPADPTDQTSAVFTFSADEPGATFECTLDYDAYAGCASPQEYTGLADGNHTFRVRATDGAGNTDPTPADRAWTVETDATAPTVTGVAPADSAVDVATSANVAATFSEAMDKASVEAQGVFTLVAEGGATPVAAAVSYDAATDTATLDPEADLTAGTTYTATVTTDAADAAGNPLATDETWSFTTVAPADTTAPETAIDAGPSGTTNETTATFAFSATEPGATFECALDGGAFAACASPTDYSGLGDGEHTFAVRAKDAAGNVDPTPASVTWTIDATAPTVAKIGPADGTAGVAAGANVGATFSEAMNEATIGNGTFTLAPQGGGNAITATVTYDAANNKATLNPNADLAAATTYTATVRGGANGAKDLAGTPLAADKTWSFTTAGPDALTVAVVADAWVESASPSLNHGTEQGFNTDNSPQQEAYLKFTVSGVTGTVTGATLRLTAYNGTPNGPKIYGVADSSWSETGITWSNKPARSGGAVDDEGAVTATTSAPAVVEYNVGALVTGNGTYTFNLVADSGDGIQFRAKEFGTAGQRPQLVLQVSGSGSTVETTIDDGPSGTTASTTATFAFSANDPGATFECALDGAAFAACASPKEYTGLADGTHTFQVRASDLAGNGTDPTPATHTWSVDATAPTVTTVAPPHGVADVATSANAEATFSEAMDEASVEAQGVFTLVAQGGSEPVPAAVAYDPATRKATLDPSADLTPNATYTAKVLGGASGAKDAAGNPLAADETWSFTVPADTTPPTVVSVLPTEGATAVAVASNVEAVFSEAMDATTITTGTVSLTQQGGGAVAATVTYDTAGKKVIFDPSADLTPETTYTATVLGGASGAKDASGQPLAADKTWSFTTADVTAPTVTSVAPADGATGVAGGANVAAVFSEAMDATTLTPTTFTLVRQGTTTPVAAPVNYDAAAKRATLDPAANLAAGATYTATVKGGPSGAKDTAQNPLAADKTWMFTTASTTSTVAVEADAWVESANPGLNHGTELSLNIDNSPLSEGFLRFTVSGASNVSQAKLRLYAYNGTDNAPKVYRVTDTSWSETGITWSTKPARSGTPVDTTSLVPTNSWVEYDVSSMVTANGTYTFNLVPDSSDLLQVRSREYAADPTLRPQLVLTVGAPGGPETTFVPPVLTSPTNQTSASFAFTSNAPNATFECKLDTGTFSTCTSPQEYAGLAAGPHTFQVRAIDEAGNPDETPATHSWTIDTAPPTVTTVVPADGATNAPSTTNVEATFSEAMDPATLTGATFMLVAQGSGSPVAAQVSPAADPTKATLNPNADLTPGVTYNATVSTGAKDAAGNTLTASYLWSFTVADTTPPETAIDAGPSGTTNQTSATFAFSANEQGATFECRLDGGAWASCTSPTNVTSLTEGAHTFEVRAIDAPGNVDPTPASHTWTVDTTPPTVTILAPANAATGVGVTANVEATFSEPMNAATVTATGIFTLTPQGGSDVAAEVAYDPTTRKATLNPEADLAPNTTYTAKVSGGGGGAKDTAQNALAADRIWSFTTSGTAPTLAFGAQADAWVESANPGTNYGNKNTLKVDSSPQVESFLRFAVSGTNGTVTSAKLRLYATSATVNGPAVYAVPNNSWSETGITWNNKPERTGSPSDDEGAISAGSFVEFDVTPLVAGDGTYSFNLVGTSDDVVDFASRSNATTSQRPQLLVTFNGTLPLTVSASPAGGTYTTGQSVTLTASEEPSTKYYTTDGSDPTTSGTRIVYGGPITIAASTTLKFYAVAPDARTSPVVSEVYTIASTTGYQGHSFTGTSAPTSKENESKLWYNDGSWWGVLYNTSTTDFQIYRLDSTTQEWSDTGVKVDLRNMAKVDVLWDGTKLFTLAHHWNSAASGRAELRRFSYNAANDQYTQELGPILVNNFGSETAVLAKDTTGTLWVTYTQDSKVYVTRSAGANHDTWVTPYVLPTAGSSVYSDDISTIVSFGGKIGVLWSNQCDQTQGRCSTIQNKMLFAWHSDGAADNAWTEEVAYDIPNLSGGTADEAADDHMNIKVDSSGRLYAAFKTSLNASGEPLIGLLVRETNGTWSSRTVFTADFNHTRPIVLIDEQNGVLYVFASEGPGTNGGKIYYKQASLSNPSFPAGIGTVIIENGTDVTINNVNSTKQNVDSTTGIVIIAGEVQHTRYYHNVIKWG